MNLKTTICAIAATLCTATAVAQTNEMVIDTKKVGAEIRPTMYGLFFEDINYAADGGLYGEMVKNRSFEFPQSLMGWNTFGNVTVRNDGPFDRCPHYVRLAKASHREKRTGLDNEGFFGIAVKKDNSYRISFWARTPGSNGGGKLRVEIVNPGSSEENQFYLQKNVDITSADWKKYEVVVTPDRTDAKAVLRIFLDSDASVDLEHVSMFPTDTWKGHANGLRKDLAQALADIKPGVFRFPGGCIVEGTEQADRYQWKNTVGPVENRPTNISRWQFTFTHRFYPDYFQSFGLGFYEYFLLAEEMGAEPLPVLSCGLVCQFQNSDEKAHVAVDSLDSYVQDAIDLVEFANGDTSTKWGKVRADMGHPVPFNLKYIGIGNEQWGETYPAHLKPFVEALRRTHPEIKIVGSSGPYCSGDDFDYLWSEMRKQKVDLVDEHFYQSDEWFRTNANRYDSYSRKGPRVFAGEYACHEKGKKWNHFAASLLEAAFMTGLERNADVVEMATYAPLFAHVEGWQWRPDLIWFDNLNVVRTASYYVQQLYGQHKGTNVLLLTMNGVPVTGADGQNSLYASAALDKDKQQLIVKVANIGRSAQDLALRFTGMKKGKALKSGKVITLSCTNPDADNTIERPDFIVPQEKAIEVSGSTLSASIPASTFAVYILGY